MSGQQSGLGWPSSPGPTTTSADGVASGGLGWPAEVPDEPEEQS